LGVIGLQDASSLVRAGGVPDFRRPGCRYAPACKGGSACAALQSGCGGRGLPWLELVLADGASATGAPPENLDSMPHLEGLVVTVRCPSWPPALLKYGSLDSLRAGVGGCAPRRFWSRLPRTRVKGEERRCCWSVGRGAGAHEVLGPGWKFWRAVKLSLWTRALRPPASGR
jgi:hypothetical protein